MKNVMLKSVFFAAMALFISASSFAATADKGDNAHAANSELAETIVLGVDILLTSKGGCEVHIQGNVSWSLTFTGTITLSGDYPCPNGVMEFSMSAPEGNIEVSGDEEAVDFLNGEPSLVREAALRMGLLE